MHEFLNGIELGSWLHASSQCQLGSEYLKGLVKTLFSTWVVAKSMGTPYSNPLAKLPLYWPCLTELWPQPPLWLCFLLHFLCQIGSQCSLYALIDSITVFHSNWWERPGWEKMKAVLSVLNPWLCFQPRKPILTAFEVATLKVVNVSYDLNIFKIYLSY